jgi:hypothetical protein
MRTRSTLARPVAVDRDRGQLLAFREAQNHAGLLSHGSIPQTMAQYPTS